MNFYDMLIRRSRAAGPAIPQDFVFWAPLTEDLLDHSSAARTQSAAGASGGDERSGIALTTKDGIACTYVPRYARLLYTPRSGINIGNTVRTESIWLNCAFNVSGWNVALGTGQNSMYQLFALGWNSKKVAFGGYFNDQYSDVTMTANSWNHIAVTYDLTAIRLYLNGTLVKTSVQSGQVNTADSDVCIGGRPTSSDNGCDAAYLCGARIYNRALSADEIQQLAAEFTPSYTASITGTTFTFYPAYETKQITYSTHGETPTFEIVSGTLPSNITFNTSTGEFYGIAATDEDHSYSVRVRVSSANCSPAEADFTIATVATARISISSKSFTFYRDGSDSGSFNYTGDEPVTLAIETGYTLPSGITFSGNSFYSDGTTTTGSYTVVIRGISEHNQTGATGTMYLTVNANVIDIKTASLTFYPSKGAQVKAVKYTTTKYAITPVFSISGTLPSGVTFDTSTGEFASDGTQSADETASVTVTVASSTGYSTSDTQSISLAIEMVAPSIPTDALFYLPLSEDYNDDSEYARTVAVLGNSPTYSVVDGVPCAYIDGSSGVYTDDDTDIQTGDSDFTLSYWMKFVDYTQLSGSTWRLGLVLGTTSGRQSLGMGTKYQKYYYSIYSYLDGDVNSPLPDNTWHSFICTHDSSDDSNVFYIDGQEVRTDTCSLNLGSTRRISLGYSRTSSGGSTQQMIPAYYSSVRIYDRVLDAEELEALYTENLNVAFSAQTAKFYGDEGAGTYNLTVSPSDCTFALTSGTLPSGVTLSSAGVLSYDGTAISQDSSTDVTITASKAGYNPTSATVTIKLYVEQSVPDDYIWYTPFTSDYTEETSGIVGVPNQPSAFSIATDNSMFGTGYLAARKTQSDTYGIEYAGTATYMDLSAGNITISLWLRAPNWTSYSQLLGGTRPNDGADGWVLYKDGGSTDHRIDFRSKQNTNRFTTAVDDGEWHNWIFTRTAAGAWTWYKDGVVDTSGTGDTSSINGSTQNMKVGGGTNWGKQAYFDLVHLRVYNRVLDSGEINLLATEFTQPASTPVTAFSKAEPPTMSASGNTPSTHFAIEQGRLYFSDTGFGTISGTATQIGTRTDWEQVTELSYRTNTASYDGVAAIGIAGGRLQTISAAGSVITWSSKLCTLVSGYHIKYLDENNMEYFGLAVCSDGLYRVSNSMRWKINSKYDWVCLSGGVCNYNSSYYNDAYGIDSQGTCYRIAYDGTLTQVETGMTACAGTYAGGSHLGNWGDVTALTRGYNSANDALFIRNGALYYTTNNGKIGSTAGTLIDDSGTWTAIYGTRQSGTGIRDGKFCTISTSGYTATAFDADAVGDGCYAYDGLIYNKSGNRVTSATYN